MAQSTTATRPIPLDEPFRTTRIQLGSCLIGEYIDHPSGVTAEVLNRCHGEHVAGRILRRIAMALWRHRPEFGIVKIGTQAFRQLCAQCIAATVTD